MPPSSCIVDSATELTPTVAGANRRAATTQYSSPTAEVSPELSTSASPSRATGLILPRRSAAGDPGRGEPRRPAGGQGHLLVHPHLARLSQHGLCARPTARWQHRRMSQIPAGSDREQAVLDAVPTGLFIGGTWRPAASGATLAVDDPATGKTLVEVANASPDDGRAALDAAVAAQPGFAALPPRERGEILRRAYELIIVPGRRPRPADDAGDGQAAGRVEGRGRLRRGVLPLVRRGGRAHRRAVRGGPERREPLPGHAPARRRLPAGHARGTSPWPWAPARSVPPSPPAAPWSSSPRSRPRCRCTPSPRSSPRRACPTACSTS